VYLGAIIVSWRHSACSIKGPLKWWMLAAIIFSIFMAWGKYFADFKYVLYNYMPLYISSGHLPMSLYPQFLLPLLAALGIQQIFFTPKERQLQKSFKPILYTLGGCFCWLHFLFDQRLCCRNRQTDHSGLRQSSKQRDKSAGLW